MSFGAESYELVLLTKGKQQGDTLLLKEKYRLITFIKKEV